MTTKPTPASPTQLPYCKQWKAGCGLGMRLNSSMKSSKSTFITSVSISGKCGWKRKTSFTREEVVTKTISHFPGHILFPQPHTTLHPHDCKSLEAGMYELCTFASLASNLFGKCQRGGGQGTAVFWRQFIWVG